MPILASFVTLPQLHRCANQRLSIHRENPASHDTQPAEQRGPGAAREFDPGIGTHHERVAPGHEYDIAIGSGDHVVTGSDAHASRRRPAIDAYIAGDTAYASPHAIGRQQAPETGQVERQARACSDQDTAARTHRPVAALTADCSASLGQSVSNCHSY